MKAQTFSYWEQTSFVNESDVVVIGSGLVGLSAALHLKATAPGLNVVVLERGFLPAGASTKNAGFACFGTVSEQIANIKASSEDEAIRLAAYRWNGLQQLRQTLGDSNIDYRQHGGYELFMNHEKARAEACIEQLEYFNQLLLQAIGQKDIYTEKNAKIADFGFTGISRAIYNRCEGQIDTGKMMRTLLLKVYQSGVLVLNQCDIESMDAGDSQIVLKTSQGNFKTRKIVIATNAFAAQLLPGLDVVPGRGQVLITKPISNLKLKGTYHFDEGYYYFRNINNRVLFGGGRNIDFEAEKTADFGQTEVVKEKLSYYLRKMILPGVPVEIDYWWSGIMGFGGQLSPIIKQVQPNVFCAVRCNGMGIAMGSLVGKQAADLLIKSY